jgi:hypothetical protein
MLLSSMPELFASLNFSPKSYLPSFISIVNLQDKGGLAACGSVGCAPRSHI